MEEKDELEENYHIARVWVFSDFKMKQEKQVFYGEVVSKPEGLIHSHIWYH